jgi:hypothetical protein
MRHSNSLNTAEDGLLTEEPKPRRSGWWKWALGLILVSLFVYRSTRPVIRLSAEPPPSFYDHNRTLNRQESQRERQLARAYWNVAVRRIQTSYPRNRPLPTDPPPQFLVSKGTNPPESAGTTARAHYWYRLRGVWNDRDTWEVSYRWNTDWVKKSLNAAPRYVPRSVMGAFQKLVNLFNDIGQEISAPS